MLSCKVSDHYVLQSFIIEHHLEIFICYLEIFICYIYMLFCKVFVAIEQTFLKFLLTMYSARTSRLEKLHPPSERLASLGIMEAKLKTPRKPLNTIVL